MKITPIFVTLLCIATVGIQAVSPAARLDIPITQIDQIKDQLLRAAIDELYAINIPDINITKKVLFWEFGVSVANIKLDDLNLDFFTTELDFAESNKINFKPFSQELDIKFDLNIDFFGTHKVGTMMLRTSKANMALDIALAVSDDRKFSATIENTKVDFGKLDISIGDSFIDNILDLVVEKAGDKYLSSITEKAASAIQDMGNKAIAAILGKLDLQIALPGTDLMVDLAPLATPVATDKVLQIPFNLDVYKSGSQPTIITPSVALPEFDETNTNVAFHMSEEMASGVFDAVLKAVNLKLYVTQTMIPDTTNIELNTTYMNTLLPNLGKEKPDQELNLLITNNDSGSLTFNGTNKSVDIDTGVGIGFVLAEDKSEYLAATSTEHARIKFTSGVESLFVYADYITLKTLDVDEKRIAAGDIVMSEAKQVFSYLMVIVQQAADSQVLSKLPLKVPEIAGLKIKDYIVDIEDKHAAVNLNFVSEPA